MTEASELLTEAARILKNKSFSNLRTVNDLIEGRGATHFVAEWEDDEFSVRAKEYRYKDRASFGIEHVEHAAENDHLLVSFIAEDVEDRFRVYHPEIVLDNGRTYTEPSKNSKERTWIECQTDRGAELAAYLRGEDRIDTPSGFNATLGNY